MVRSLGISTLSVLTIGISLAVLATFAVIVSNLAHAASELGQTVQVSAYLKPETPQGVTTALVSKVEGWPEVAEAKYLSPEEALKEFKTILQEDAVLLEGLPSHILPASIEVKLKPKSWAFREVKVIGEKVRALTPVEDVRYGQEDLEKVAELLAYARMLAFTLGLALSFATIVIIYNTIRLTVYARRDEIEIMGLVGATGSFVRAPFVMEGALQGVLGGLVAAITLISLEGGIKVVLQKGLNYAVSTVELSFVPLDFGFYLILAGAGLGLMGSLLAVGKFLRV